MDKATSEDKDFLGLFRECSKDSSVLSNNRIPYSSLAERANEASPNKLRNITDFEFLFIRQPHSAAVWRLLSTKSRNTTV